LPGGSDKTAEMKLEKKPIETGKVEVERYLKIIYYRTDVLTDKSLYF
jgi:hypothetical protein